MKREEDTSKESKIPHGGRFKKRKEKKKELKPANMASLTKSKNEGEKSRKKERKTLKLRPPKLLCHFVSVHDVH